MLPSPAAPFQKFDNQSEDRRLSHGYFSETEAPGAGTGRSRILAVSKKHSGSLLMAPPFYSKNGVANNFSRVGLVVLRTYMESVWGCGAAAEGGATEPAAGKTGEGRRMFEAWWKHAEAHGLCYSFECVVPRLLGDHGATPRAAYVVLTSVALTPENRFLSPTEMLALATQWKLPLNETWFFPQAQAPVVEDRLHSHRWTLKDHDVDALLEPFLSPRGSSSLGPGAPPTTAAATSAADAKAAAVSAASPTATGAEETGEPAVGGIKQAFLTHTETQGPVLEGFVLLALEADLDAVTHLVRAYEAATQPRHGAVLAALLELGQKCLDRDEALQQALLDGSCVAGFPEPRRLAIKSEDLWGPLCTLTDAEPGMQDADSAAGGASALSAEVPAADGPADCGAEARIRMVRFFQRLRDSYKPKITLKAYAFRPWALTDATSGGDAVAGPGSSSLTTAAGEGTDGGPDDKMDIVEHGTTDAAAGGAALQPGELLQIQIDVHDDNVFFSWGLHMAASHKCPALFRGDPLPSVS